MGVHPDCLACLIVTASFVAVETDVGETISAVKVAFVVSGLLKLLRSFLPALFLFLETVDLQLGLHSDPLLLVFLVI